MLKAPFTLHSFTFLHENVTKSALWFEMHVYVHETIKMQGSFVVAVTKETNIL